ncbi:hypothetical protein BKA80DRAFT_281940 [Phyllosticta citrichinensis]
MKEVGQFFPELSIGVGEKRVWRFSAFSFLFPLRFVSFHFFTVPSPTTAPLFLLFPPSGSFVFRFSFFLSPSFLAEGGTRCAALAEVWRGVCMHGGWVAYSKSREGGRRARCGFLFFVILVGMIDWSL